MPRLVQASRTSFSRFVQATCCIRDRGEPASSTALYPLPLPSIGLFGAGIPKTGPPGLNITHYKRDLAFERVLYIVVLGLNYLHSDFRHVPNGSLRRQPTELHCKVFSRIRSLLRACSEQGSHSLCSGRRGPRVVARLSELALHLQGLGLSTLSYPRGVPIDGLVPHDDDAYEALRPYRDADPDRLKISGSGTWNLEKYLSPESPLALPRASAMRANPENSLPYPQADLEEASRTLRLLKLWDKKGLLYLSFLPKGARELSRVFGARKDEKIDRMIGDRRGPNGLEGRVLGPSRFLPQGHLLTQLTVPAGHKLVGASTDRADFYHQARISACKAEGNSIGPRFRLGDFADTDLLQSARALVMSCKRSRPGRPCATSLLQDTRLVTPGISPSVLFDDSLPVRGAFRSLYQGDHSGVEVATEAHTSLLQLHGLLGEGQQLLAKRPVGLSGPWDGLIIDDFFSLSTEPVSKPAHLSAAALRVEQARACYAAEGVAGSPHKDINGAELFQAAGAQINSTPGPLKEGRVLVSAPTPKVLSLAYISLKAAALPAITEELASNLAGSWISVLMFRRCLFAILDSFFALGKRDASHAAASKLRFLPRKAAQEIVLLAVLSPLAASNVAAEFCDRIFCSDSSSAKGAFCSAPAQPEVAASMWLGADKKGCYTMLSRASQEPDAERDSENEEEGLFPEPGRRPLAFDFDVLCFFSGAEGVADLCAKKGLRVSPIIDTACSIEYDLRSVALFEWAVHLIWTGRARSLVFVLPSSVCKQAGTLPGRTAFKGYSVASRCIGLFKAAVRASVPAFLFFKRGSAFLSNVQANGLLAVSGVSLVPRAPSDNDPVASPGIAFAPRPLPDLFFTSRGVPGTASAGVASLICRRKQRSNQAWRALQYMMPC